MVAYSFCVAKTSVADIVQDDRCKRNHDSQHEFSYNRFLLLNVLSIHENREGIHPFSVGTLFPPSRPMPSISLLSLTRSCLSSAPKRRFSLMMSCSSPPMK